MGKYTEKRDVNAPGAEPVLGNGEYAGLGGCDTTRRRMPWAVRASPQRAQGWIVVADTIVCHCGMW